jgi:hypothetical protein
MAATGARAEALMRSAASAWGRRLEDVGAGARGRRRPLRERAQRSKQPQQGSVQGDGCAPGARHSMLWMVYLFFLEIVASCLAIFIGSSPPLLRVEHQEASRCICQEAHRRQTAVPSHPRSACDMRYTQMLQAPHLYLDQSANDARRALGTSAR